MACPYLASYRSSERDFPPTVPGGENVCYAAGSAYWPYAPVQLALQRSLCLRANDYRRCPRYRDGLTRCVTLPQGSAAATADVQARRRWWRFWR